MATIPFSGGDKLQSYLDELSKKVSKKATLNVGFLDGATYPDGTSVPVVAAIQEFGAPASGIPPRPFFRDMIAEERGHWGDDVGAALVGADYDAAHALALMGEEIKGELRKSIADFSRVPLAEATVKAKGFDKQLVDTGHMLNSVDSEVKE